MGLASEVKTYPVCPACDKPVAKAEEHELRFQLVNADPGAPKDNVDMHAIFHMKCAAKVWTAARDAWRGEWPE